MSQEPQEPEPQEPEPREPEQEDLQMQKPKLQELPHETTAAEQADEEEKAASQRQPAPNDNDEQCWPSALQGQEEQQSRESGGSAENIDKQDLGTTPFTGTADPGQKQQQSLLDSPSSNTPRETQDSAALLNNEASLEKLRQTLSELEGEEQALLQECRMLQVRRRQREHARQGHVQAREEIISCRARTQQEIAAMRQDSGEDSVRRLAAEMRYFALTQVVADSVHQEWLEAHCRALQKRSEPERLAHGQNIVRLQDIIAATNRELKHVRIDTADIHRLQQMITISLTKEGEE
ncbi:hypothetical protein BCR43DRAFT_492647 [Syncephalastrum racemosum]|uniref:Uncharacterized protein n=1 Tax=Syncephalastrum racemosum TaxID=13706 RepID=A0A1X2H989_SYNRA|nr:hypothetical protein BCR43DRAFT_492647 [Syncephalastrum racemosum]